MTVGQILETFVQMYACMYVASTCTCTYVRVYAYVRIFAPHLTAYPGLHQLTCFHWIEGGVQRVGRGGILQEAYWQRRDGCPTRNRKTEST